MALIGLFDNATKCCGCKSCVINCPTKAIEFSRYEHGQYYPKINQNLCVHCNICDNLCVIDHHKSKENNFEKKFMAFVTNDKSKISISSSGGAFLAIIKAIFEKKENVVVYGAEMTYNTSILNVVHTRYYNYDDCRKFSGSKYVSSDLSNVFGYLDEDIKNNRYIIFSGLPCQIEAIKNYLSMKKFSHESIFFIDLICHGVGSKKFFDEFITELCKKYNSQINEFRFRDKRQGWKGYPCYVEFKNGKELNNTIYLRNFPILYLKGYLMRKSCFNCNHSNLNRISDITLGDFWGIEKTDCNIERKNGVSLIIFNTHKSNQLIDILENYGNMIEVSEDEVIDQQDNLNSGHIEPEDYHEFWGLFESNRYNQILKQYGSNNLKYKIRWVFKKIAILMGIYKSY